MNGYELTAFIIGCVTIIPTLFRCWNRLMRHLNIKARGWPPEHCDADGDFKSKDEP